jgi:ribulose-phosphate 3-epimerase
MSRPVLIAPSILSADFARLAEEVAAVERAGADFLHIDVMDGHFVPNLTIGPPIVAALRKVTKLPLDVHLMITNADAFIAEFAEAGADYLTVHVEACPHLHRTVQSIKERGVKAGVTLNPATSLNTIEEILPDVDLVLIMSVNPGFGGQTFIASCLQETASARAMIDRTGSRALLEVDGGVKIDNAAQVLAAGADVLVAGSAIFSQIGTMPRRLLRCGQPANLLPRRHGASPLTDRPRGWIFLLSSKAFILSKSKSYRPSEQVPPQSFTRNNLRSPPD